MNNILIVLTVASIIWSLERLIPNNVLEKAAHWYRRAFIFNSAQAVIAVFSIFLWDVWFAKLPLFSLRTLPIMYQVCAGYLVITFIYYWWHRFRHSVPMLWRYLHQLHHSPARIEVITSFYKHPLEILVNGLLTSAILYILLGLSASAVGLCVLTTALAELIYHMNIKTPRIMGLFFQRPEMHRIHHQRGLHHYNYSDLPVWDMLFGTYNNPAVVENKTGFPDSNENKVWALLKGQELES
ncbi:MAG: sterol desaturase family protein [Gammaproteobacteria bacterium]